MRPSFSRWMTGASATWARPRPASMSATVPRPPRKPDHSPGGVGSLPSKAKIAPKKAGPMAQLSRCALMRPPHSEARRFEVGLLPRRRHHRRQLAEEALLPGLRPAGADPGQGGVPVRVVGVGRFAPLEV